MSGTHAATWWQRLAADLSLLTASIKVAKYIWSLGCT